MFPAVGQRVDQDVLIVVVGLAAVADLVVVADLVAVAKTDLAVVARKRKSALIR